MLHRVTMPRRALGTREVQRRVHERDVRERLREVAEHTLALRIILFCEETNIVHKTEEPLEVRLRLFVPTKQYEHIDVPKRAGEKCALSFGQSINARMRDVTTYEAINKKVLLDRHHRVNDPRI